ncbi:MAG: hypothetical protein L3J71_17040 [Victivallaceae bacterium]|nr:hypothetical protein [Victivallaceae bacterium]
MLKKITKRVLLGSLLLANVGGMAANVLWEDSFKTLQTDNKKARTGWRFNNITGQIVNDALRVSETGAKHYGSFYRYVPFNLKKGTAFNYLQIKIVKIEKLSDKLSASNASSGGKGFGQLYSGWNTFDLTAQPALQGKSGSFACSIIQLGTRGSGKSGYADIDLVRIVKVPLNGLTIDLQSSGKAQVGGKLLFRYYAKGKLAKTPQVKCYITPGMVEYKLAGGKAIVLNDSGKNGDAIAGDKIYSVLIVIDKNAPKFISTSRKKLLMSTSVNGLNSSAYVSFDCNIKGAGRVISAAPVTMPVGGRYLKLWKKETKGKNLALGKPLIYSIKPTYRLTVKGGTDLTDLTDGKLSSYKRELIWFDRNAVGWYQNSAVNGVTILLDLGKVEPINKVVMRCLAGKAQSNLVCPKKFELFVSKDGKKFYRTASMQKLMPGEKSQSDLKRFFYIDELGEAYVYPFVLQAGADARYIGIKIYGDADAVFSDELAVIKAETPQIASVDYNQAYRKSSTALHTDGFIIRPRLDELVIAENMMVPNSLLVEDMTGKKKSRPNIKLIIETPPQVTLVKPESVKTEVTVNGKKCIRWTMPMKWGHSKRPLSDPLFFTASGKIPADATATFYVDYPGVKVIKTTVPVRAIEFPVVTLRLKRLHISLAWMGIRPSEYWPGFLDIWKQLGFNAVSCFPRYWKGTKQEKQAFLAKARADGYKVVMNESPFHMMQKPFRKKPGAEIYSQMPNGKSKNVCPSYRGQYYIKELERVAKNVKNSRPDYVFWDIEIWYKGAREAAKCSRCKAGQQQSGKPMEEYLRLQGRQSFADLYAAVEQGSAGGKMPIVASYNHHAVKPVHHLVTDFNLIYPEYVKLAQPSLYVAGRALDVHNSIRKNYQLMKSRNIVPWLSTGTYGELEPYKIEQMVLEALLNGASGITYYWYGDFDTSLDFYYHAKALAAIAPYEDLIMDGLVLEPTGSNGAMTYSGIRKGNEMLLLIGNYAKTDPETIFVAPFNKVTVIKDLRSGKKITPTANLKLNVPRGDIRLLYIKGGETAE